MGKLFLRLYLLIVAIVIAALAVGIVVTWALSKQELDNDNRRLAKGTFHLLIRELQQVPRDAWPEHIQGLNPEFGYPLSVMPLATIKLGESERIRLIAGEIVVMDDGDFFFQRVGDTDFAVTLGPIGAPWVYLAMPLAILIFLAGGITLAVWFWVRPLWRSVLELEHAAKSFGEGTLSARAAVSKTSALALLAQRFNAMAERIERLIDSHKELTHAVAHELRTPIARLRFGMEMSQTAAASERARYLNGMERDVVELDALIAELLDYARFDRDTPALDLRPHALAAWLHRTVDDTRLPTHAIAFRCDARITASAFFDDRLMTRAFGNILRNAARHARVEVQVSAEIAEGICVIHVDDDGPGVPVSERERIFEPFVRLDGSRWRDSGGYGLGLAIARRIVGWHDGNIEVNDAPLGGARFSLRWPGKLGQTSTTVTQTLGWRYPNETDR